MVADVVGNGFAVVAVEVGAAGVLQVYRKPKMVHVARFSSSSLGLGIARTVLARARNAVVVRNFMLLAEGLECGTEWKTERVA